MPPAARDPKRSHPASPERAGTNADLAHDHGAAGLAEQRTGRLSADALPVLPTDPDLSKPESSIKCSITEHPRELASDAQEKPPLCSDL